METINSMNTDNLEVQATDDEQLIDRVIDETVFELSDDGARWGFLSWILDLSEQEFKNGLEASKPNNPSLAILWELFQRIGVCTVILENNYVDRVYRDSYYFYYSGKHFNFSRFCKRLTIFEGTLTNSFFELSAEELESKFVGTTVIRPIPDVSIGRTLLNPFYFVNKDAYHIRLGDYNVSVYGKILHVKAFPYSMQDGETTSCAEITIINLLDYYSQMYPEYHYLLPSDIYTLAEKDSYERRLPTTGLSYELISKIFCDAGFFPRLYSYSKMPNNKFRHILQYYIESGVPVALGLTKGEGNKHSVICIGRSNYDKDMIYDNLYGVGTGDNLLWICDVADTVKEYCLMDDNKAPYTLSPCVEQKRHYENRTVSALTLNECDMEYILVPLYKRMILEAADAYDICMSILSDKSYGIKYCTNNDLLGSENKAIIHTGGSQKTPFVVRLYLASSRTFRQNRDMVFRDGNLEVNDWYNYVIFPKFIWVCEISTPDLFKEDLVLGEIVIDATSSSNAGSDSAIIIHYPNVINIRMPDDSQQGETSKFVAIKNWQPFNSFDSNLDSASNI